MEHGSHSGACCLENVFLWSSDDCVLVLAVIGKVTERVDCSSSAQRDFISVLSQDLWWQRTRDSSNWELTLELAHLILSCPFCCLNSFLSICASLWAHLFYLCRKCKIEYLGNDHKMPFYCTALRVLCQANITYDAAHRTTDIFFS